MTGNPFAIALPAALIGLRLDCESGDRRQIRPAAPAVFPANRRPSQQHLIGKD
ncbi:hypothetical protein [Vacuolonema iberomarrocanum]|uniref:hypothetical protein n=1 Tax=Vacuolonema iberomarrocanum TaxID=3454632 RepID=UPI0019DDACA7|nr:hypothetical protein [filamentous cyanobacterium LEGE 07170]